MKTNFFQQIAGLGFTGNFLLNIHRDETGVQTVSVILKKDKAVDGLPPMLFKATADELDEGFFEQLAQPAKQTAGLIRFRLKCHGSECLGHFILKWIQ